MIVFYLLNVHVHLSYYLFSLGLVFDDSSRAPTAVAFDSDLAIGKGACIYISSGNPRKACLYGVTEDLSSAFSSIASVRKICSLLL